MALSTASKKAREAIRADVLEWAKEYAQYTDTSRSPVATPFEVWQELKHQMAFEYARYGPYECMQQNMLGLSFGDFENAREHVQRWLQQSDKEASRYSNEQSEQVYCDLVSRELFDLADVTMPKGLCTEFNPYLLNGRLAEAVKVRENGKGIANVVGLNAMQAAWLKRYIDRSIYKDGALPYEALALASHAHRDAPNPLEAALRQIGETASEYVRGCMRDIDAWMRNEIGEDAYYSSMSRRDEAMRNDPRMSTLVCDIVDKEADRYFTESGCMAAKSPSADKARAAEPAQSAFKAAIERAAERNAELKPQSQNRQAVGIGR